MLKKAVTLCKLGGEKVKEYAPKEEQVLSEVG